MHSNSGGYAYYFSIVDSENTSTKDDGIINNTYKYTNGGLYDLKVTKNIEGNQGILTEKFDFSIQITADHEGEKFHVVVYNKDDVQQRAETIEVAEGTRKGTVSPISLGDDEYAVVCNYDALKSYRDTSLSMGTKLTIEGKEYKPAFSECINTVISISTQAMETGTIILPDEAIKEEWKYNMLLSGIYKGQTDEEKQAIENKIVDISSNGEAVNNVVFENMSAFTKITNYESSVGISATVTFIGLYLGITFL